MKKFTLLCCLIIFAFLLFGCTSDQNNNDKEKYTMNGSVALGVVDNNNLDKTKVTYEVVISGNKDDIDHIDSQEPLINMEYLDLMLENGPHNPQVKGKENPYLEITGSFVFDTTGKSKEEISSMQLFEGIKITDKDKNDFILKFNKN